MLWKFLRWLGLTTVVVGLSCVNVSSHPLAPIKHYPFVAELVRHLYIEPTFTTSEVAMVIEGARRWEVATKGTLRFCIHVAESPPDILLDEPMIYMTRAYTTDMIAELVEKIRNPKSGGTILGWTFQHRFVSTIVLFRDQIGSDRTFVQLVVHELGHSLGINHLDDRHESVMYPMMDGATDCPTVLDLEALCDIYGCDVDAMAPCHP